MCIGLHLGTEMTVFCFPIKESFSRVLERTGIAEVQLVNTARSCPRLQIIPESSEKVEEVTSALTLDRECRTVGKP